MSKFQKFLLLLLGLLFIAIALGLGLGLCLGLKNRSSSNNTPNVQVGSTSSGAFNYSSYYGIPANLPIISTVNFTNTRELELTSLITNKFNIDDTPTTRCFELNVTQVLAAPDGYQKPMIAINSTFPVLEILSVTAFGYVFGEI